MCTRMTHPEHGSTHAYGTDDIQRLRGYGWVPDDELNAKPELVSEGDEHLRLIKEAVSTDFQKIRQKPGPKPKPKAE